MKKINVLVKGYGYWGKNIVNKLKDNEHINNIYISDPYISNSNFINTSKIRLIDLSKDDIEYECSFICTHPLTHYDLASEEILKSKHVFIEKPFTYSLIESEKLIKQAASKNVKLGVGHVFEYTAEIKYLKNIINSNKYGKINSIHCERLNLGKFQNDINVMWDLAPHDISIILNLLDEMPIKSSCKINNILNPDIEDDSYIFLDFKNTKCTIHNSWIYPKKTRTVTIIFENAMIIWDDVEQFDKIKIYENNVSYNEESKQFNYKYGDLYIPYINKIEPLKEEVNNFLEGVILDANIIADGIKGLNVVKILNDAYLNKL